MDINKCEIMASVDSVICKNCWLNNFSIVRDCANEKRSKIFVNKEVIKYNKGDCLIKCGEPGRGVYCIQSGIVKVFRQGSANKEFILWIAGSADIVGLNSFINNESFSFSATAVDEVTACFIPTADLNILLAQEPSVFLQLTKNLCEKLDFIEQRITSISGKNIREQCAEILIAIASKNDPVNKKHVYIDYSINDLASLIGTTKNYLYKILSEFTNKKILSVHNRKWIINNIDALSSIAKGNNK